VSHRVAVDLRPVAGALHSAESAIDRAINLGAINAMTSPYGHGSVLPRKEVIQPHLPVRLPCYDFVPITDPTFDGCLPCGLAHRLRVLPAFMT
jgi:hypothetical protein